MNYLVIGCALFIFMHLFVSGTPLRGVLVGLIGEKVYLPLYSIGSFIGIGLMVHGYNDLPHSEFLWYPSKVTYVVTKSLMLLALVTLVMGTTMKNPTQAMNDKALDEEVTGMLKITRHPIQWSILLFAIAHLVSNGDIASIILFGTLAAVSFIGMLAMDNRKRKEPDARWQTFMNATSMFPFAAILSGRTRFTMADMNWAGLVAGLALYAAIYWLHEFVSGGISLI